MVNSQLTEYAGLSPTCSHFLNGLSRVVGHSIHLRFHEYMANNGYIIYVAMLQLLIYLLFPYTTCEWSKSEFHNKVLFCSVLFCSVLSSELVHVKEVLALTRLAYQSDLLSIRIL